MNVTIKDVARQANVSVATVSRALNGHQNVAAAVRERIVDVARQLRYTPHHAARSLSSRRTHTIGVLLPDLHGEFFSELMRGIDEVARERGLQLLVSSYHGHPEEQGAALRAMRGRVDGVLVMSPSMADQYLLTENLSAALPSMLINTQLPDAQYTGINIDNRGGALAMMQHLVDAGHRAIAFIAGPADNFDAHERLRGYREAMAQSLPDVALCELHGNFDESSGHAAGVALLAGPQRPDAVFAANDMMALGCLSAFAEAGVHVPRDIALVGFDDIPLARYVSPALTTMRVDIAELGGRALRALLALPDAGADATLATADTPPTAAPVASAALHPRLIVRASSPARAAPRKTSPASLPPDG